MALASPGVEVQVIDESFYTPAGPGTVPLIFVSSAENKLSSSGSGIAAGTLKGNAGKAYLVTSQRELGELFGDPIFYSDNAGNMIHGGELNEYGLQTAYSLLGVSNRAYVVRSDLDLAKLESSATPPGGQPADGAYWFDTQTTRAGLLEWDGRAVLNGGQSFESVTPRILTQLSDISTDGSGKPKQSIGAIGTYAINATNSENQTWFKTPGTNIGAGDPGTWVKLGSPEWKSSWPVVRGTVSNPSLTIGDSIVINETTVALTGDNLSTLASDINAAGISGVFSAVVAGSIEIYSTGVDVDIAIGTGNLIGSNGSDIGIAPGTYSAPRLAVQPHTNVPTFKESSESPAPSGSIWLKTTRPNGGVDLRVKRYNEDTQLWEILDNPVFDTVESSLFNLDRTLGGLNILVDELFVKSNFNEYSDALANYKIFRRASGGPTEILSSKITDQISANTYTFSIEETLAGSATRSDPKTVSFTSTGSSSDAEELAGAINAAGFVNVTSSVTSDNKVLIQHGLGGDFRIADTDNALTLAGFESFDYSDNTGTTNLYNAPDGDDVNDFVASNWKELDYVASENAPLSLTADGELWYNSIVDEVDLLVNDGTKWVGLHNFSEFSSLDSQGPIVSSSKPTQQSSGAPLVDGDLWISTNDIDSYPRIYRYNNAFNEWQIIDTSDQTTESGILFADARWSTAGQNSEPASIQDLLTSDYLDPDAPDPTLYPRGMLLWNLRRSGFNVKRFVRNYIDVSTNNTRFDRESMETYYPHRWVTDSGNNQDGSGTFGRLAQRKSVIQSLQATANSNQDIRDEEIRQFNLIACPGYPELIGEMVTLNYDRRLTAFVVGDTPARLTPDATSLNEWATNVNNAVEDNDEGAVSRDEYLGMYYPWGFSSDNFGNNVVVPPSHMALRTLILNDQVAFPWFAPAGTRRGGVTNATASGFVDSEGEFVSISLNTGQRDTLYTNSINPITVIAGAGLVVFGQKTRARNSGALDRINVARLVVYLRKQFEQLARPYLFEPNDRLTRDQIRSASESLLLELVSLRALYDFLVVCDESNNTPSRIDRNELWLDVAIEPVKAIEFIYIPLRIKNTGEIAQLG